MYKFVKDCRKCFQNKPSDKQRRPLQLFHAGGQLELFAMDILEVLSKALVRNQLVLVITDPYKMLSRAIQTSKNGSAPYRVTIIRQPKNPALNGGILFGGQHNSDYQQVFESFEAFLRIKQPTTTAVHRQASGPAGRFNKTKDARLQRYLNKQGRCWEICVQTLRYMGNAQVQRSTNVYPFSLVRSCCPEPATFKYLMNLSADGSGTTPLKRTEGKTTTQRLKNSPTRRYGNLIVAAMILRRS